MKKCLTAICILVLFLCAGCSNEQNSLVNGNNDTNNITLGEYLKTKGYSKIGNILCDQITENNIKQIGYINQDESETYMIINGNEKYNLSLKLYSSTNSNCKKSTGSTETNMISNLSIDNTIDIYASKNYDRSFVILNDKSLAKISTDNINVDDYGNKTYHGGYDKVIVNLNDESERLINLNGWGDYPVLKTDKGYYSLTKKIMNEYECNIYEDVECQYEYVYDFDDISKFYDEIFYYGGGIVLDKDMNLYTKNVA